MGDEPALLAQAGRLAAAGRFWRDQARWYGVAEQPDLSYDSHTLAFFLSGSEVGDDNLYVMITAFWQDPRGTRRCCYERCVSVV
jgi:hypothetical protein